MPSESRQRYPERGKEEDDREAEQRVVVKRLLLIGVAIFAVTKYTERGRRARKVYAEEVAAGARPIQAVGTSIAAFVGLAPEPPPPPR